MMSFNRSPIIGLALLSLASIWFTLFAERYLENIPKDFQYTADIISTDNFYDSERKDFDGAIFSKTNFFYQAVEEHGKSITIRNVFDVRTPEGDPIFSVDRLYGVDRKTGKHVPELGDKPRTGYLFAPHNLKPEESFTYWHINYDGPANMQYVGKERLYGLPVYHYETHYEGVPIDQTANLGHLPEVGVSRGVILEPYLELWIEPVTGMLIKYKDNTTAYFYDLKTKEHIEPWNKFTNTFDEKSVEKNVLLARLQKTKIRSAKIYIPFLLLLLIVLYCCKYFGACKKETIKRTMTIMPLLCGYATITIAILVCVGWIIHNTTLIYILFGGSGMNPLTAICFVALGCLIVLQQQNRKMVTKVLSGAIVCIGIMRLASWQELTNWHVDLVLFKNTITAAENPARMSAYTALSFILLGIVPCIAPFKFTQKLRLTEILPTIVLLLSIFSISGYMFDVTAILAMPILFSAAIHTSILFLCTSLAIYALFRTKSNSLLTSGWLAMSSVLFVALLVTVAFAGVIQNNLEQENKAAFNRDVDSATSAISERLHIYINALQSGKGLFASSDLVERDEWKSYVQAIQIQENYPGIQGMGYAIFLQPEEIDAHIESIQSEGFPEYTIRPTGERSIYTSIIYLEPFDIRNQQAFGFDMFQESTRRLAMEQARDTGKPHMSGRITLVQEIDEDVQPGFLIYIPFYQNPNHPTTLEERRESIVGYIYAPFRARDFVAEAIKNLDLSDVSLRITDGTVNSEETTLYDDAKKKFGADIQQPHFTATKTIYIAGRPWMLSFKSTAGYGNTPTKKTIPLFVLIVGIIMSSLIAAYFYAIVSTKQKAENLADDLTKDLRLAKAKDEAILAALDKAALVSITNRGGDIIFANKKFIEVSKYNKEELIGQNHRILKSGHQPESLFIELWETIRNGHIWRGEIKNRAKDGSYYWVDTTITPITDDDNTIIEYMAVRFLITDKKEAEQNLQQKNAEDEAMLESIGDGIIATDSDGKIILINNAFENILGWTKNEVLGKNLAEIIKMYDENEQSVPKEYRPISNALNNTKQSTDKPTFYKRKDGSLVPVKVTVTPTLMQGRLIGAIEVFRDITEEKALSDRQQEFISLASHQLRTPLTAIRWAVSRLAKNKKNHLDNIELELAQTAHIASMGMSETISTMLRISQIESGKPNILYETVPLHELCTTIEKNQCGVANLKNISLTFTCDKNIEIESDKNILNEIVTNLTGNAIKYTPEGGAVQVEVQKTTSDIIIRVQDNGHGIPADEHEKIFRKFFRASNAINLTSEGTGLGLYLVHLLTKSLDGTIRFESNKDKGTTFTVQLPLSPQKNV